MGDMADNLRDWEYRNFERPYIEFIDGPRNRTKVYNWTTKDGRKIPLPEMTIEHLENTYNFLIKKGYVEMSMYFKEEINKRKKE